MYTQKPARTSSTIFGLTFVMIFVHVSPNLAKLDANFESCSGVQVSWAAGDAADSEVVFFEPIDEPFDEPFVVVCW